jgi:uncharacterized protein with PQ loop repeat
MLTLHHIHRRKKHPQKETTFLDYAVYFASIVSPLMTLPQLYLIWVNKMVSGISVFSWSGFVFFNIIWIYYGIVHKDKPIIIANLLWALLQSLVVIGVFLNRGL